MNRRQYKKVMLKQVSHCAFRLLYHTGYVAYIDESFKDFMMEHYVLEGEIFRKARSYSEWLLHMEMFDKYRRIAQTYYARDSIRVSTVFLGIDHNFGAGLPLLFESMIFINGGPLQSHDLDGEQDRYYTYEQALTGHRELCELVKSALKENTDELHII